MNPCNLYGPDLLALDEVEENDADFELQDPETIVDIDESQMRPNSKISSTLMTHTES